MSSKIKTYNTQAEIEANIKDGVLVVDGDVLTSVYDRNILYTMENILKDIIDKLHPKQTPTEQAIYSYLFRWSYLENGKSIVIKGKRTIAKECSFSAKNKLSKTQGLTLSTVSIVLRDLQTKKHIKILDTSLDGHKIKVLLPNEIIKEKKLEQSIDYYKDKNGRLEILKSRICTYCGKRLTKKNATIDHIVPQSRNGNNDKSNLVSACLLCNSLKGKSIVGRRKKIE